MYRNILTNRGETTGFRLQFIPHAMRDLNDKRSHRDVVPVKAVIQEITLESPFPDLLRTSDVY